MASHFDTSSTRLEVAIEDAGAALDEVISRVRSLREEERALLAEVTELAQAARVKLDEAVEGLAQHRPPPESMFDLSRNFESKDRWLLAAGSVVAGIWTNDARMGGEPCIEYRRLTTRAIDALYRDTVRAGPSTPGAREEAVESASAGYGVPKHAVETAIAFEAGRRYALEHSNAERTIRTIVALTAEWRRDA